MSIMTFDPNSVRKLRKRLGLSQREFCGTYGIGLATYRSWEKNIHPNGISCVLLTLITRDPDMVKGTLAEVPSPALEELRERVYRR